MQLNEIKLNQTISSSLSFW